MLWTSCGQRSAIGFIEGLTTPSGDGVLQSLRDARCGLHDPRWGADTAPDRRHTGLTEDGDAHARGGNIDTQQ